LDACGEFIVATLAGYGCDVLGTAVGLKGFDDVFAGSATCLWGLLVLFEEYWMARRKRGMQDLRPRWQCFGYSFCSRMAAGMRIVPFSGISIDEKELKSLNQFAVGNISLVFQVRSSSLVSFQPQHRSSVLMQHKSAVPRSPPQMVKLKPGIGKFGAFPAPTM
jgi:hypothetical protein